MAFSRPQVTSRANTDLVSIDLISANTSLSPEQRMARILKIADEYRVATSPFAYEHKIRGPFWPARTLEEAEH